jgi:hypothetical protein
MSWYDHGFGAITWFSADTFSGFPTGCKGQFSPRVNSGFINTDKTTNKLYDAFINPIASQKN